MNSDYDMDSEDESFLASGQWPTDVDTFELCMMKLNHKGEGEASLEALGDVQCQEEIKSAICVHWGQKRRVSGHLRIPEKPLPQKDAKDRDPYDCFAPREVDRPKQS